MSAEFITREVNSCFAGMFFKNDELVVFIGFFIGFMALTQTQDEVAIYFGYFVTAIGSLMCFVPGRIRGKFIRKGLSYHIYKDKIELYVAGELFRTHKLKDTKWNVQRHAFGKCLVFKPDLIGMLGSDSIMGFASDTLKGSAELIIYNCKNVDEIIDFIKTE